MTAVNPRDSGDGRIRLELQGLTVNRGPIRAVHDLDVRLEPGRSVGLVGSNGSGKTSLVEALAGLVPSSGNVLVDGRRVSLKNPGSALAAGIALCPANRGIFHRMTVWENLLVGGHLRPRQARALAEEQLDRFPGLVPRRDLPAGQLSGGERQMLAIARALMTDPGVLLLDEPSRGLSPAAVASLLATVSQLTERGVVVLIADQAVDWLHERVDRLLILASGRLIGDSAADAASMDDIIERYFDLR